MFLHIGIFLFLKPPSRLTLLRSLLAFSFQSTPECASTRFQGDGEGRYGDDEWDTDKEGTGTMRRRCTGLFLVFDDLSHDSGHGKG